MIEVKNQFTKHGIFWWFALPLVATVLLPMAFGEEFFLITQNGVEFFKQLRVDTDATTKSANAWFKAMFIDTKIFSIFNEIFANGPAANVNDFNHMASKVTGDWNKGFWNMQFRAIWRLHALWPIYIAGILAIVIPAFFDGLVTRAVKKYNFQVHNPVIFYTSAHFAVLVIGLAYFIPFLPVSLDATYIGGFFILLSVSIWQLAANFQSGV